MRLDLYCPVELCSYELTHDDRGHARAYLKLRNLSRRRICRFEAVLTLTQRDGSQRTQPLTGDNFDGAGRKVFSLSTALEEVPQVCALEIAFSKVFYDNGDAPWEGDPSRLVEILPGNPLQGPELDRLIRAAGSDAMGYPREEEAYWACVCGRPNGPDLKACLRCGRERLWVFEHCTPQALDKNAPRPRPAAIDLPLQGETPAPSLSRKERKALARKNSAGAQLRQRYIRQRSLLIRRSITMVVIFILLVLAGLVIRSVKESSKPADSIPPLRLQNQQAVSLAPIRR